MDHDAELVRELALAKTNKHVVSVFSSTDDDSHHTGYVLEATPELLSLRHFAADGAPDGKVLIRIEKVFHVDVDGKYERRIAFLAKNYDKIYGRK